MIDTKKLLRRPRKGDAIIPAPTPLDRYRGDPTHACARGYRRAAQILVEHTREPGGEVFLFYPLVFLYRHHIELMLKNILLAFDEPDLRRITQAEPIDRKGICQGKRAHSLQCLWDKLRPLVQAFGTQVVSPEQIEGINYYIRQLTQLDPDSARFRYTSEIEATKARLREAQGQSTPVDLRTFAEAMETLAGYLDGLHSYVAEIISFRGEK